MRQSMAVVTLSDQPNMDIQISQLVPADEAEWNRYVDAHPLATAAHRAEWKKLIKRVFGKQSFYLIARSGSEIVGVLPLVHMRSLLFGNFIVSVPYLNYGGVLANNSAIEAKLLDEAARIAESVGATSVEYREQVQKPIDMPCRLDKVAMLLQLPETEEQLAKQLGSKLRSQIKRPQRENPQVTIGRSELVTDFYEVFSRNMRDLGTPVYSKNLFREVLETFPSAYIIVIYWQGKPVATAFLLGYRGVLEIPWASTVQEVNHLSMNMLLYWEVLRSAIAKGYKEFDFGRSTKDAGTYRFKKQWGAEPKQLYWYSWLKAGESLPELKPDNPKFDLAIRVWKKMPLRLTKMCGPALVKHLP
jgi:FemAB-related protein (PEP-CTERM system-associated)